ncbi:MAG: electron transfer flavoprotein subunit beta/FixA family protein [Proteobacteria bacterium]|nr:electron transfer flavoprotein subunit beta/FixA family protein [Pseudomonadota bacterium]
MHIVVGIKQTPDHEGPRESYEINHELNRVEPRGIPPVLSLFDENALEAALRIKDTRDDVKITIVSIGRRVANAVMIRALAAGADELIKVEDEQFEAHLLDTPATARIMGKTLERIGDFDLVLVGRQASDFNSGYMGIALGHILNIPCITFAQKVEIDSDKLTVNRVTDAGHEVVTSKLPAVVMVSNELGELRYPAMKERREAKKKPVQAWSAADIDLGETPAGGLTLKRLYYPELKTVDCRFVEGENPANAGRNLAKALLDSQILPSRS